MAKYSYEFKKMVVQAYLNGEGGTAHLSKKYQVPAHRNIQQWIESYKKYGNVGLMRSKKNENYSFEFKMHVVELYLTTEVSYQELALFVEITNPPLIAKWVNDYRIAGPDALRPKRKGRKRKVTKPIDNTPDTVTSSNDHTEYIKQLEDELLKLKIENAYLKELRRLRLEGIPQSRKRESSTVSEDHLN